jgi:hypothetical protein
LVVKERNKKGARYLKGEPLISLFFLKKKKKKIRKKTKNNILLHLMGML